MQEHAKSGPRAKHRRVSGKGKGRENFARAPLLCLPLAFPEKNETLVRFL